MGNCLDILFNSHNSQCCSKVACGYNTPQYCYYNSCSSQMQPTYQTPEYISVSDYNYASNYNTQTQIPGAGPVFGPSIPTPTPTPTPAPTYVYPNNSGNNSPSPSSPPYNPYL